MPTPASALRTSLLLVCCVCWLACLGCSDSDSVRSLRDYSLDSAEGLLAEGATLDSDVFAEGTASLRVDVAAPRTVRLYATGDVAVDDAALVYSAQVRPKNLHGRAYLEMWCHFPRLGSFFARGLDQTVSDSDGWTTVRTTFYLEPGQDPEDVSLNLVVDGTGTVWIDDIHLAAYPLR